MSEPDGEVAFLHEANHDAASFDSSLPPTNTTADAKEMLHMTPVRSNVHDDTDPADDGNHTMMDENGDIQTMEGSGDIQTVENSIPGYTEAPAQPKLDPEHPQKDFGQSFIAPSFYQELPERAVNLGMAPEPYDLQNADGQHLQQPKDDETKTPEHRSSSSSYGGNDKQQHPLLMEDEDFTYEKADPSTSTEPSANPPSVIKGGGLAHLQPGRDFPVDEEKQRSFLNEQAEASVLGFPVVQAEEIELSTASFLELRRRPSRDDPDSKRVNLWQEFEQQQDFIDRVAQFRHQGFPLGLATEIVVSTVEAPTRMWIVDNNFSLEFDVDQHVLRYETGDSAVRSVPCTRWSEIQEALESHMRLADLMSLHGLLWMIRGDRVEFTLRKTDVEDSVSRIRSTPTSDARLPWKMIFEYAAEKLGTHLMKQEVVLILAGMRLPSNKGHAEEFYRALSPLRKFPSLTIVVRLAAPDKKARAYYESLGRSGMKIHVMNDFLDHATRVAHHNPWLNYTLPLHRCREMGFNPQVFTCLENRPLTNEELREFFVILFGKKVMIDAPDIAWDWADFYKFLDDWNTSEGLHWRMVTGRMEPWIDMHSLESIYGSADVHHTAEVRRYRNEKRFEI